MKCFSFKHFHAVLFRKWIILKRSWVSNIIFLVISLLISSIAIIFHYAYLQVHSKTPLETSFKSFQQLPDALIFVNDSSFPQLDLYTKTLQDTFYKQIGRKVPLVFFKDFDELNDYTYNMKTTEKQILTFGASVSIQENQKYSVQGYVLNFVYNNSYMKYLDGNTIEAIATDALWKTIFGTQSGFNYTNTLMTGKFFDCVFSKTRALIIMTSYGCFIPRLLTQSINDVLGNSLTYMLSCGLKISSYWIATFSIDILIWIIFSVLTWLLFLICSVPSFLYSSYYIFYALVMSGPSVILFTYALIHFLPTPKEAPQLIFLIFIGLIISQMLIEVTLREEDPYLWEEYLISFIPPVSFYRSLELTSSIKYRQKNKYQTYQVYSFDSDFPDYTSKRPIFEEFHIDDPYFPHFIMNYVNIIIYGLILSIIKRFLNQLNKNKSNKLYPKYKQLFDEEKAKNQVSMTKEAIEMENEIENSKSTDYAVRINKVSRLFFDNDHTPVLAVNSVSLGIHQGSLFGFLGANGAGKTTLISMITSLLNVSSGTIEINGQNVNDIQNRSNISVCPQFNDHLIPEMTPLEHLRLYSLIFDMDESEIQQKVSELIYQLQLQDILKQKVTDISHGDLRKFSLALAFFGPASVIFLDEPTTALDSISRTLEHQLILNQNGSKTILLCTHHLDEAEMLCDQISIMNKGCIYAVDTPQNLKKKFGTSIKIDVMLNPNDQQANEKCSHFFNESLPQAVLAIERPSSRIYRISNKDISLVELFKIMEDGKQDSRNGYNYFTCTSSSLEQTFLEIVRISENGEIATPVSMLTTAEESKSIL